MKHFKTTQNTIRAIEPGQERLISEDWQELTAEQIAEELDALKPAHTAAQIRDEALAGLTHDFGDGRVIQCRPVEFAADELNMRNAIERMQRLGITQQLWFMADDTPHYVSIADLEAAIASGQDQGAAIWEQFIAAAASESSGN